MSAVERITLLREKAQTPAGALIICGGCSMQPTVMLGERVCVWHSMTIQRGDVVVFATADQAALVLHRVVLRFPGTGYFLHTGDAGRFGPPGLAHKRNLIGRADLPRRRPALAVAARSLWRFVFAAAQAAVASRR